MAALFPPYSNTWFRAALTGLLLAPVALLTFLATYVRTPWNTQQFVRVDQPVEFDHRHHVVDDEIDCLYCHPGAEISRYAGVPATEVCMGCHSQVWSQSPLLEGVRRSYFSGAPIAWNRVHDLPDFAYFDHSVHFRRGVGCVHCHGRVDQMARIEKVESLSMGFCLDCHRAAESFTKARTSGGDFYDSLWGVERARVKSSREITRSTTCTACHR